jgi:hypothetical protein
MGICSVEECDRQAKALGYCPKHYERFKTHGTTEDRPRPVRQSCGVEECDREAKAFGYCNKHYQRLKKYGDPNVVSRKDRPKVCTVEGCGRKHNGRGFCDTHRRRFLQYGTPTPEGIKFPAGQGEFLSDGITKTCSTCYIEKPVVEFSRQSIRPDGLNITCKICLKARHDVRYKDPVKRQRMRDSGARWRERNPDADADKRLRRVYGITLAEYNELFEAQGGVCALCKKGESTKRMKKGEGRERLAVDHCHDTGRVRGLLCFKCNTAIGSLGDTEEDAQRVVDYLSSSQRD